MGIGEAFKMQRAKAKSVQSAKDEPEERHTQSMYAETKIKISPSGLELEMTGPAWTQALAVGALVILGFYILGNGKKCLKGVMTKDWGKYKRGDEVATPAP